MALSVPLNGLKEEDKEPLIELFVKVSARRPERRGPVSPPPPRPEAPPRGVPAARGRTVPPSPLPIVSAPRLPASQRDLGGPRGRGGRKRVPQGGTRRVGPVTLLPCPTPPRPEPKPRAAGLVASSPNLLERSRPACVKLKL